MAPTAPVSEDAPDGRKADDYTDESDVHVPRDKFLEVDHHDPDLFRLRCPDCDTEQHLEHRPGTGTRMCSTCNRLMGVTPYRRIEPPAPGEGEQADAPKAVADGGTVEDGGWQYGREAAKRAGETRAGPEGQNTDPEPVTDGGRVEADADSQNEFIMNEPAGESRLLVSVEIRAPGGGWTTVSQETFDEQGIYTVEREGPK